MTEPDVVESGPLPYLLSLTTGSAQPSGPRPAQPSVSRPAQPPSPRPAPPPGLRPVLCFLHGLDEGPPTGLRAGITRHGPLRAGSREAGSGQFIVVAPQLPARGDHWALHADAVRETVPQVHALHGGDPARTYLTGFSYGANGVFDVALLQRELWAALWPVDPTRVPPVDPGLPVCLSSGQLSRPAKDAFMRRLQLEPVAADATSAEQLPDRVYVDYRADHVGTATRTYHDPRIYDWLLSRRLGAAE